MAVSLKLADAYVEIRGDLTQLAADLAKARAMLGGLGGGGAGGLGGAAARGAAPTGAAVEQAVATGMAQGVARGSRASSTAGPVQVAVQSSVAAGMAQGMTQGTRDAQGRLRDVFGRFVGAGGGGPGGIAPRTRVETTGLGLGRFLGLGGGGDAETERPGGPGFLGRAASSAGGMLMARGIGTAMAVPGQIAGALFDAAKKASDLGESVSKVGVTFGPAAGEVIGKTDQLAERFGVVKQEALDAAASFGLMALAAGQTKEQAAATGNRFVQMGLDIASFHNIANAEAFEKLRSGLAGEIEPLRQIGILLSEDAVQAKALEMGLVGSAKEAKHLTQQQKVEVRTELIAEQMGPAAGDLERTAGSAANQLRKLQGDMENFTVEFGKELQGALTGGISLARELGKIFSDATGGKEMPKVVGEAVKAVVDDARTAVSGEGAGVLGRLNMKLGEALSSSFKVLGLGENFLGVKDTLTAMKREQEGATARATGMALEAGPVTGEQQIEAMKKSGDPAQMARSAQSEAFAAALAGAATERVLEPGAGPTGARPGLEMAREQDRRQAEIFAKLRFEQGEGLDLRMNAELGKQFARPGGIPEVSKFSRQFRSPEDLAEIERREALAFFSRPKEPEKHTSEMFADPADYARSAIQTALSAKDDSPKQTAEATKRTATLLQTLADAIIPVTKITPGTTNTGPLIFKHE